MEKPINLFAVASLNTFPLTEDFHVLSPTSRIQLVEHAFLFFFVNDFQGR